MKIKKIISVLLVLTMIASALSVTVLSVGAAGTDLVNVYYKSTQFSGYLDINGKEVGMSNGAMHTSSYIPVKTGDIVTFGPCDPQTALLIFGFDTNKQLVAKAITTSTLTLVDDFGRYVIYSWNVPENVTYVRVVDKACSENRYSAVNDIFTVTVNQPFDCEMFLDYWDFDLKSNSRYILHGQVLPEGNSSILYGKSALFCGDSISAGSRDFGLFYEGGWGGRIGTLNHMNYTNASVGGARLSTLNSNRVIAQIQSYRNKEYDFVILHGGINDAWETTPAGTVTADSQTDVSAFNTSTYAGALEELFYYAKQYFPDATLGYIINFHASNHNGGIIKDMSSYIPQAIKACEKWGIPYLNLYDDDNFNQNIFKVTTTTYLPDYLHPNAGGYDVIYSIIEDWMKDISGEEDHPVFVEEDTTPGTEETTDVTNEVTETTPTDGNGAASGCNSSLSFSAMLYLIPAVCVGVGILPRHRKNKTKEA